MTIPKNYDSSVTVYFPTSRRWTFDRCFNWMISRFGFECILHSHDEYIAGGLR